MKNLQPLFLILLFSMVVVDCFAGRCEKISSPLCQNIGYNSTIMPNFMGHHEQKQAEIGLLQFQAYLNHKCSPYLRLFVCSLFVPMCSEHVPESIPACKGLCEQVKGDCLTDLSKMGLTWPDELNCSRFPEPPNLCMQQPTEDNQNVPTNYIHSEDIIFNLTHCPPNTKPDGNRCVPVCKHAPDVKNGEAEAFEIWVAVWSIIGLVFTIFALVTFLIQPRRFRWPARPILYLVSCGFISSTIYLIRWIKGPYTCTGDSLSEKPSENLSCVGISLILLFCDIAYSLWWCVFSFVWFLSAMKEWSTEAIEKISTRLHTTVWILSALPMLYVVTYHKITMNYSSGFCEVKNVPLTVFQLTFIILSINLCILTSIALKNVRNTLVLAGRSPLKLERLFYRLLIISIGICIPHFVYLICQFYDTFEIELFKLVLKKISIIFSTLWVFSPKTFSVWKGVLKSIFTVRNQEQNNKVTNEKKSCSLSFLFPKFFKKSRNNNITRVGKSNLPLMPVTRV